MPKMRALWQWNEILSAMIVVLVLHVFVWGINRPERSDTGGMPGFSV